MQTEELFGQEQPAFEISTISTLALFETNRPQRKSFVEDVIETLRDERADPLKVHIYLKAMEEIITMFTVLDEKKNKSPWLAKEYRELLLNAAEKHGKKFNLNNAEFSIKETGTSYDWTKCEDSVLNNLLSEKLKIDTDIKARQEFLKNIQDSGLEVLDKETGDMTMIYKPAKSSTTAVSVSLK